jgi:hypothetical protein
MSRIEKIQPVAAPELPAKPRRRKRSCLPVLLAVLALLVFWLAWLVASTGLVEIPIISRFAYDRPTPWREVSSGVPLETLLTNRLAASATDGTATLFIPEATLTTSVRDFLAASGQTVFDHTGTQIAVSAAAGVELFLPLRDNALGSAVRVRFHPTIADNRLQLEVAELSLGSWQVGSWLRQAVVTPAMASALGSLNDTIAAHAAITTAAAQDGALSVTVQL